MSRCHTATVCRSFWFFDSPVTHSHQRDDNIINRSGKTIIHLPEKLNVHVLSNKCDARKSKRNPQSTRLGPLSLPCIVRPAAKLKLTEPTAYRREITPENCLINYSNEYERTPFVWMGMRMMALLLLSHHQFSFRSNAIWLNFILIENYVPIHTDSGRHGVSLRLVVVFPVIV